MADRTVVHKRGDSVKPHRSKRYHSVISDNGDIWGKSVMTLRTGKIAFSFGRERRFRRGKADTVDVMGVLPSGLNPRSTSFGYGQRWTPINPTGKDAPPPTVYDLLTVHTRPSGYSFGQRSNLGGKSDSPGPGTYETRSPTGSHAPKFSIRLKLATNRIPESPPPDAYRPSTSLVQRTRFREIGFGYGKRTDSVNKAAAEFPGPGTYFAPGQTAPVKRTKKPKRLRLSSPAELLSFSP